MGAPNSEIGYTSATSRRGDHEFYMDMWWHWGKKNWKEVNAKIFNSKSQTQLIINKLKSLRRRWGCSFGKWLMFLRNKP
jgi:hypothetical protein